MGSVWTQTARLPRFSSLKGDLKTEVLIIGGGLAGLLCAYRLEQAGVDYALVEAKTLCSGVSQNTTAKITSQHGLIYTRLYDRYGKDTARLYFEANQNALEQYRRLCRQIDCDFQPQDAYVYTRCDPHKVRREARLLADIGAQAEWVAQPDLPFAAAGAVRLANQAQFHPLRFAAAIANGLRIYEHTKVTQLAPGRAVTPVGTIRAEKIVVATHFPMLNKHGAYFLKLYQHRSYVLALKNLPAVSGMYVDEAADGLSLRCWNGMLLLGGGGHRTGKKGGGWQELEAFAQKYYPNAQEAARWATQDCITLDGMPYIGQYAKTTPDLYVATGFNKWGMTAAMAGADLLADLLLGRANAYASVFAPDRTVLHPQLACNAASSLAGLLTPTRPRCPHMGCALHYNPQEHSWDCACHGSRFDRDGRLLDNPATDDIRL